MYSTSILFYFTIYSLKNIIIIEEFKEFILKQSNIKIKLNHAI